MPESDKPWMQNPHWLDHIKYVHARDFKGMIDDTFTDDVIMYHNFEFFKTPPPYVVKGKKDVLNHWLTIFQRQGDGLKFGDPIIWSESADHIAYQIFIESPNTGRRLMNVLWLFRDGKVCQYFSYAYKLPIEWVEL